MGAVCGVCGREDAVADTVVMRVVSVVGGLRWAFGMVWMEY